MHSTHSMLPRPEKEVHGLCERLFSPPTPYGSPFLILRGCFFRDFCLPPSPPSQLKVSWISIARGAIRRWKTQVRDRTTQLSSFQVIVVRHSDWLCCSYVVLGFRYARCGCSSMCLVCSRMEGTTIPLPSTWTYCTGCTYTPEKRRRNSARSSWALIQTA
ncbi:hypothetical protein BP00DRAFT_91759 [Aspergillus indologenus CBS 114.80]|uniref:Uncharacterized protein n=1 Tax=Aspergillus indologenus CBS 114.80 TaxID=1450541 RepID=A0A2V5IFN5_9EURO|nr:hypothetical protein BP00DRAFT_91759 [Aspergillus indologenus CBS 114.80]